MSALGMGNDGAGSLRWPAQCCGVAALKPSLGRVAIATQGRPRQPTPFGFQVLDLGCGSGLDSLLAARTASRVLGVDFSPQMLARARAAADSAGVTNVEYRLGAAEAIPAETGSIDIAIVNGIFNLNPARTEIFRELARVVRDGGCVFAAELTLAQPLPADRPPPSQVDWFA